MNRAGRRYSFWCRHELLMCISVFRLLLLFSDVPARDCRLDRRQTCQLQYLWPLGCHRSKLCCPLMRRGRPWSWHDWTRSGRGNRPRESRSAVAKHCDETGYIMRCERVEQLILNAGEGKGEFWCSFRAAADKLVNQAIELPSPQN